MWTCLSRNDCLEIHTCYSNHCKVHENKNADTFEVSCSAQHLTPHLQTIIPHLPAAAVSGSQGWTLKLCGLSTRSRPACAACGALRVEACEELAVGTGLHPDPVMGSEQQSGETGASAFLPEGMKVHPWEPEWERCREEAAPEGIQ